MWDEIPINLVVKKPFNFFAAASGHGYYSVTKLGRHGGNTISDIYNTGKNLSFTQPPSSADVRPNITSTI